MKEFYYGDRVREIDTGEEGTIEGAFLTPNMRRPAYIVSMDNYIEVSRPATGKLISNGHTVVLDSEYLELA